MPYSPRSWGLVSEGTKGLVLHCQLLLFNHLCSLRFCLIVVVFRVYKGVHWVASLADAGQITVWQSR